jgi:hypothetical protein
MTGKNKDDERDSRKNLVLKARAEEVKHQLRKQLQKEKKHQWYINHKKNYPYSRDVKQQVKIENEINPPENVVSSSGNKIPITSVVVGGIGLCCAWILVSRKVSFT